MKRLAAGFLVLVLLLSLIPFSLAEEITYTGVVKSGSLHLRAEPNASSKVLGTYKSGKEVTVLENDGTWCRVQVGKKTGYMMTQYLEIKANYPHLGWGKTQDNGTVLNLRDAPGFSANVTYKTMSGCALELVEAQGDWYRVRLGEHFGYVEKSLVSPIDGEYALGFSLRAAQDPLTAAGLHSAVREVGNPILLSREEGDFTYSLHYPDLGINEANTRISSWVQKMLRAFEQDHEENHAGRKATCTVEYQALKIDSRYESVLLIAEYTVGDLKAEAMLALNVDVQEGRALENRQLFSANALRGMFCLESAAAKVLSSSVDGYSGVPDETWLDYAVMDRTGLRVCLPSGLYLPVGLGSPSILIKYGQIAECMPVESEAVNAYTRVIDPSKPMIALTFDDGPSEETDRILAVLLEYNARATFCVLGNRVADYGSVIKRAVAGGNEIACHTWSHAKLTEISSSSVRSQIQRTLDAVREVTGGYEIRVLRPPYGSNNKTVRNICADMGLVIAHWQLDTKDWSSRNANKVYKAVMNGASNGYIVLCHDLYSTTADAMEKAIPDLIEKGYQLVTVSELLSFHVGGAIPGKVYNRVDPENIVTGK